MTNYVQMSKVTASGMRVAGVLVVLSAGLFLTACPSGVGSDAVHNCATDNTAQVSFRNTAGGIANMYVDWDGINITGTIVDGATSAVTTVNATSHFLVFRISASRQDR